MNFKNIKNFYPLHNNANNNNHSNFNFINIPIEMNLLENPINLKYDFPINSIMNELQKHERNIYKFFYLNLLLKELNSLDKNSYVYDLKIDKKEIEQKIKVQISDK